MQLDSHPLFHQQCFINGHWCDADNGATTPVVNPATGDIIGHAPALTPEQIQAAITSAQQAQLAWQQQTAKVRSEKLYKWYQLLVEHAQDIAFIITCEQGKPLAEAKAEVMYAASYVQWYAEEAKRIYGEQIPAHQSDLSIHVSKQAVGVCAAITPWNFPAAMITRKLAPALAAGCSMLVKPAPQTPFTAFALAKLAHQAGFPAGLVNVLTGDANMLGQCFTESPIIRKISFTGSTAVGVKLMQQSAPTLKKLSLELGGNAPFIVLADADVDQAVTGLMLSKFRNNGQTCICANRIYVHQSIYAEFGEKLSQAVAKLHVGRGDDPRVTTGPLINLAAVEKVQQQVDDALSKGAKLICGGQRHQLGRHFYQPTILANVTAQMLCTKQETFGPVAPLIEFDSVEDVINQANDTEFGLAAYVFGENRQQLNHVVNALEYGMVGINTGLISTEVAPFGGIKSSGFGREGGRQGLEEYLTLKYKCHKY
ncbi:NAD-dependent succinate-semialdehyde dehydrogenase [Shewanella maritima]|uniref:NAD-dependent succinate-semialdehyde dehydrogenase n=1 Tax=Shewanella maritima TaxID=2520507 RepID=UPI003736C427